MADLPDNVLIGLLAGALALLFAFAWVATGPMPKMARMVARASLTALLVLPVVLWLSFQSREAAMTGAPPAQMEEQESAATQPSAEAPESVPPVAVPDLGGAPSGNLAGEPAKPRPEPKKSERREAPARAAEEEAARETTEAAPPPPPPAASPAPEAAAPESPEPSPPTDAAVPGASTPAVPSEPLGGAASGGGGAGAPAEETKYDVVPVYYGTDRAVAEGEKRLDYGAIRGRRLALGQALVTVPKVHEVPQVERPWVLRLPYVGLTIYEEAEDPEKHFTMKEIKGLSREEFLAVVRERLEKSQRFKDHAVVFVHGFNTTFENAVFRTAQIAYDLKFDGAPFTYSWPSGGGVASYTYDRESAGQSTPFLREFLELVMKETGAKRISVIAHSMGNQPTLQVLKDLKAQQPGGPIISEIILAAPDVDRDNFENIAREIQGLANGVTLYAARNDYALDVSRRFHGGVPRAGDVPDGTPIVLQGVDTIDVSAVSTDSFGLNHSGYAENNAILSDIQQLIESGIRPPEKRLPRLERVETDKGPFWRFPGAQ